MESRDGRKLCDNATKPIRSGLSWIKKIKTCCLKQDDPANGSLYKAFLLSWLNCRKKTYNKLLAKPVVVLAVTKTDDN